MQYVNARPDPELRVFDSKGSDSHRTKTAVMDWPNKA